MQKTTLHMLKYLWGDEIIARVGQFLLNAGGSLSDYEQWNRLNTDLETHVATMRFEIYSTIAKCQVMCVASAPDYHEQWLSAVIDKLLQRKKVLDHALTAYEMGSLIGIFQAGALLHKKHDKVLNDTFFKKLPEYMLCWTAQENLRVANAASTDAAVVQSRQDLEMAIQDYFHPTKEHLRTRIASQVKSCLNDVRGLAKPNTKLSAGPGVWIVDALVKESLNMDNRSSLDLIPAATAMLP